MHLTLTLIPSFNRHIQGLLSLSIAVMRRGNSTINLGPFPPSLIACILIALLITIRTFILTCYCSESAIRLLHARAGALVRHPLRLQHSQHTRRASGRQSPAHHLLSGDQPWRTQGAWCEHLRVRAVLRAQSVRGQGRPRGLCNRRVRQC